MTSKSETLESNRAKAVVVLGRDDDVLHPRILGRADPSVGVELDGIELVHELVVDRERDMGVVPDPLAIDRLAVPFASRDGVQPPVDEQPEPRLAPPLHARVVLGLGLELGVKARAGQDGQEKGGGERGPEQVAVHGVSFFKVMLSACRKPWILIVPRPSTSTRA